MKHIERQLKPQVEGYDVTSFAHLEFVDFLWNTKRDILMNVENQTILDLNAHEMLPAHEKIK